MTLVHDGAPISLTARSGALNQLPELKNAPAAFRTAVRMMAANWIAGTLTFELPSGRELRMEGAKPGPDARIVVRDYRFISRVLAAGDIGFAEGYMAGEWDTPDLAAVLEVVSRNSEGLIRLITGNPLFRVAGVVRHLLRANTRKGAQKNIHAHYDLGNAFYSRWLDETMTYSSARYAEPGQPLSEAQRNKYRSLAESIGLQSGQHVLEIGCGWGGFAEFAARDVGAKVTAITISKEQHDFARERMFRQGLNERAEIRFVDYRDVEGRFDRVASIEMFEAVGEQYWPAYFEKIAQVLSPGGLAGLQIITIRDEVFDSYRRRMDFIQRYIFPGGMLPSEERLRKVTGAAGLAWHGIARFGQHYADTLAEWRRRFDGAWDEIRPLGFDERFRRLWRFYLSYCEAGFRTGQTNVVQLALAKA
ncbi:MAG: cyclopropane-fatty-acyl-phospholipid synthase family protein [Phenylobacterium sp.]|jgi:cyclopropane-fatty-acyl-phospholipid synthase|uniref:cyclopropane-fatty-acyl-phospholipid synthase family protein n=1 Tax=Phenylobacterium sp. TaxID=1871053 RepID=UPI002A366E55|nr:cyclopropane-fatty-acyl-phospholipid synthase family protein [Phenylobacterium sp.]MDX9998881.1 cyclopropane-fatty-acyl-phospholipid synthase family protein [Phenylobacterium sp.]